MTALFFVALAIFFGIWFFIEYFDGPAPTFVRRSFTVPGRDGSTLTADIVVNEHDLLTAEEELNKFAILHEHPGYYAPHVVASNVFLHLRHYGKLTNHRVISARLQCPDLPPAKPPKPSMAESLVSTIKAKDEAASAIAELLDVDLTDINGASLKVHRERYAKGKIAALFYHDDRS